MSKKRELLNVIESYKGQQEIFKNRITEIMENTDLTQEGVEKRINELAGPFEVIAEGAHYKAIQILDNSIEALEKEVER